MTDLAAEATLWNGLKLVLQLLALITVKACGFMLSAWLMKWYSKHYGKDKEAERKKEAEKMYEHEFDYESDWEDVGEEVEVEGDDGDFELESENECTPTGQTDNLPGGAGKKKPKNNKQGVKDDDAWVTETEELLSKIRLRRMKDDLVKGKILRRDRDLPKRDGKISSADIADALNVLNERNKSTSNKKTD